jgi:hypothetical protein
MQANSPHTPIATPRPLTARDFLAVVGDIRFRAGALAGASGVLVLLALLGAAVTS